jgi:hypothetical protein
LLAAFATTGFRQVFVKEVLGAAYDSQAEHFLRGNVDVDGEAVRHEAMIVKGHARMYFGPFPAFLRIPLNFLWPAQRGSWSRLSGLSAGIVALVSFAMLVTDVLEASSLGPVWRRALGIACVTGFAFGTPLLLLLGNLSIYDEAIIWGLAWSVSAIFFLNRAQNTTGPGFTWYLLGFSFSAGAALLSRVTFGLPFLLIAPALFFRFPTKGHARSIAALVLPVGAALIFYFILSYARFGNWSGVGLAYYINPVHSEFAKNYGAFSLNRVPYGFADYFSLRFPRVDSSPPFVHAERPPVPQPSLYSLPFSETYLSVVWSSSWLLVGAVLGIVCMFQRNRSDWFTRYIAAAFFIEFILIQSHFSLAQRYAADLYPFLIFCFVVFLKKAGDIAFRLRYLIPSLVLLSCALNSMATISWLVDLDQNVPQQTRDAWKTVIGRAKPQG